ncbi:hypothetical protein GCK72_001057 [Caenorhabditis remanei]|uniref:PAN-3 domain-containing protein n=1 Tax=Caenorhabditis remanei TaxID=31234 RepID=A0A6A5HTZ1_CAERE|nr:hypothetical protein GCK72_001057 [Caenorhabditis remanei]KAF1769242.1 hypothetical protein GCK72_001057 [Caenorhabditis remanei]
MNSRIFILCIFLPHVIPVTKLIKIYGEVESGPIPIPIDSGTGCVNSCYMDSDCLLANDANGQCSLYSFSATTTELKVMRSWEDTGSLVYFKVSLLECPSSFNDVGLTFTSETGERYNWKKTEYGFSFARCRDGWKEFDRSSGVSVCMMAVSIPGSVNKTLAQEKCESLNSTLIGLETEEEAQWMFGEMKRLKAGGRYWLAGERITNSGIYGCTSTDFNVNWGDDGMTTGNDIMKHPTIADLSCLDKKTVRVNYVYQNAV